MSLCRTQKSSIGAKWTMALTGLALVGFVLAHMAGNLQIFAGRDRLNHYAESLKALGPILWLMRGGLLAVFGLHVWTAFRLDAANRAARPVPYRTAAPQVTGLAARTMLWSGLTILAFVLYHLAHFTVGVTNPADFALQEQVMAVGSVADAAVGSQGAPFHVYNRHDVYAMVVHGFQVWWIAGLYLIAQAVLAIHIRHGASSALQTLGVTHPLLLKLRDRLGPALAVVVFVGNVSIPAAIQLGLVK